MQAYTYYIFVLVDLDVCNMKHICCIFPFEFPRDSEILSDRWSDTRAPLAPSVNVVARTSNHPVRQETLHQDGLSCLLLQVRCCAAQLPPGRSLGIRPRSRVTSAAVTCESIILRVSTRESRREVAIVRVRSMTSLLFPRWIARGSSPAS